MSVTKEVADRYYYDPTGRYNGAGDPRWEAFNTPGSPEGEIGLRALSELCRWADLMGVPRSRRASRYVDFLRRHDDPKTRESLLTHAEIEEMIRVNANRIDVRFTSWLLHQATALGLHPADALSVVESWLDQCVCNAKTADSGGFLFDFSAVDTTEGGGR